MKLKIAFAASLIAFSLDLSYVSLSQAQSIVVPVHAFFSKTPRKVKFGLINRSGELFELKMGGQIITLNVGQSVQVNLPVGTQILFNNSTEHHKVGDLIIQVVDTYRDANVVLHN